MKRPAFHLTALLLLAIAAGGGGRTALAAEIACYRTRTLEIPFRAVAAGAAPVTDYTLWYTTDGGQTWQSASGVERDGTSALRFVAPADGRYGFRVTARDGAGHGELGPQPGAKPDVECVVDTRAPRIDLRSPKAGEKVYSGSELVLEWSVTDANLPAKPVSIEYRRGPKDPWTAVRLADAFAAEARLQWFPPFVDGELQLRVAATDRAGNRAEIVLDPPITVVPFDGFRGSRVMAGDPYSAFRKFPIFYRVTRWQPFELDRVEIWHRRGSGPWEVTTDPDRRSPFHYESEGDDEFFFYLRCVDRNGEADRPKPGPDAAPDLRVTVDTHPPEGNVWVGDDESRPVLYHRANEPLAIHWRLSDENLASGASRLEVSLDGGESWQTLKDAPATKNGEGSFTWQPPSIEVGALCVRIIARDLAGNRTAVAAGTKIVLIDPRRSPDVAADEHYRRALVLCQRGDPSSLRAALENLDVAIHYEPENADAWHDRGVVQTLLGQHVDALASYAAARRLRPGSIAFAFSEIQGHLNVERLGLDPKGKHLDEARHIFAGISRVQVLSDPDFQELLATYKILRDALYPEGAAAGIPAGQPSS